MTMRVLLAEDDPVSRRLLGKSLTGWGFRPILAATGLEALESLLGDDSPRLALLDWTLAGMDGVEICRRVRARTSCESRYILLLTARGTKEDLVASLEAGADDYLAKPFDLEELRARLRVGLRIMQLQRGLAERIHELEQSLTKVKQLQGLIPICSYCKKIRGDENYWQQVEAYVSAHTEARFSHGICPDCMANVVRREMEALAHQK